MASRLTQKTTIYLEPEVKKFIQLISLQQSKSISQLINEHFEYQIKQFESSGRSSRSGRHSLVAEWLIVKKGLDKKYRR